MLLRYLLLFCLLIPAWGHAQVFFTENFDDAGAASRWRMEAAPGSKSNPTPAGITGLNYNPGTANQACHNYWVINNYHTPNTTPTGSGPNPNCGGSSATNRSLHITFPNLADCYPSDLTRPTNIDIQNVTGTIDHSVSDSYIWSRFGQPVNRDEILSATDQMASMTAGISTVGRCNLVLRFRAYFGGDLGENDDPFYSPLTDRSVLYSIDGGVTWKMLVKDIYFNQQTSGACKPWDTISVGLPAECDNRADLRLAFRWRNAMNPNEDGYSGSRFSSYNIDDLTLEQAPAPVPNFSVLLFTTVCRTEVVSLRDESNTFGAMPTYTWSITPATFSYVNGTNANSKNPEVAFNAAGNYSITLTLSNGCGLSVPVTRTNYITVNLCTPNTNFYSNLQEVCAITPSPVAGSLTQVIFSNNTTSFLPVTSYSWNFGAGASPATATGAGPHTVTYASTGAKNVVLTAVNADGSRAETKNAYINVKDCQCATGGGGSGTEVEIWKETFNGGKGSWTYSAAGGLFGPNGWVVNNNYGCSFGNPSGVTQPAAITNPNTNFLHITAGGFVSNGFCYSAGVGASGPAVSPAISTLGLTSIKISFWYRRNQGNCTVAVSGDGGSTYPFTQSLPANSSWQKVDLNSVSGIDNKSDIRIRFTWQDQSSSDPPLGIDEIIVTGTSGSGGGADGVFTCPVSGPLCLGQAITVPFNGQGTFNAGNTFTAQLSNASGSFASPTTIGTLNQSGTNPTGLTINATIPAGAAVGNGYRIRVVSSNPVMTNLEDNREDIRLIDRPVAQTISGDATVCLGASGAAYSVPAAVAGHNYVWSISGAATGNITTGQGTRQAAITWTGAGTATVTLRETNNCGFRDYTFAVNVLTAAPAPNPVQGLSEICLATPTATYTVAPTAGSAYTWTVTNGSITSGQGTPSINVTWSTAGIGEVRVVVSNPCGAATPTQSLGINITSGMTADMTVNGPSTLLVSEAAGPHSYFVGYQPGIAYTWSINPPGRGTILSGQGSNGVSIQWNASVGTATLSVSASPGGSCPVVSNDTVIYIINPTSIHSVALPAQACQGSTVNLTFATTGGAFDAGNRFYAVFTQDTTQWVETFAGNIALSGSNLAPPAATIPVTVPASLPAGKYYFRVRSSRPALTSVQPGKIDSLVVVALPSQGTLAASETALCQGETVDFTFTGAVAGVSYTLQRGGSALAGPTVATGSSVSFDDVTQSPGTATYRVVADVAPCATTTVSSDVSVTVNTPPSTTFTLTASPTTLCPSQTLSLTLSGSESGVSYQLLADGNPVGTAQNGTGSALTFSPPLPAAGTTTTYSVAATRTSCATVSLGSASVDRVATPPNGTLTASVTSVCLGDDVDFTFTGAVAGQGYTLQRGGTDLQGPVTATGTTVSFPGVLQAAGTASYRVVSDMPPCPEVVVSATVDVQVVSPPLATYSLTAAQAQLCPGQNPALTLSGSETGVSYQLLANGSPVGPAQNGTGTSLTFTPPVVNGTTVYRVRATRAGCPPVEMGNTTVNAVTSLPAHSFQMTPSPVQMLEQVTITPFFNGGVPTTVVYHINPGNIALTPASPESTVAYTFPEAGTYTVTQTISSGNCTSTVNQFLQVVKPANAIILPTAFSPNNDGLNDRVEFDAGSVQSFHFIVFNSWGVAVFQTINSRGAWDGRMHGMDLPEGVYLYKWELVDLLGKKRSNAGTITLIR
ncbi:MAG: gliding motility-associated C-terminal domain-containing protein [Bacteroidetes bacterium]|nr:gliding motility-associated C-terminal domain-containing protein [Bacteroidota bacterium]